MDGHLSFDGSVKKIGLSSDEPHRIEPTLSRGEAERVYKGITVEGDEALQKLIEDFTG